ncbi:MAG: class E sortase [Oscillospiraceae bacterium]|nr:class E sortase [Oscillospiraceae bacterium]
MIQINQPAQKEPFLTRSRIISLILGAAGIFLLACGLWMMRGPGEPPAEVGVDLSSLSLDGWDPSLVHQAYPAGKLVVTTDREDYQSGDLRLLIPILAQDVLVQDDVDAVSLQSGPGLYEYSQLPAADVNANVSIAGHRDVEAAEFYYIDRLSDGDLMYLLYEETVYVYLYESTEIIRLDNWNPIACKEYPCLTLTSCDPIGTFVNRIVVTGRLVDVWELNDQVVFAARADAEIFQNR